MAQAKKESLMIERLTPLKWPEGWTRTLLKDRTNRSAWSKPFDYYEKAVAKELNIIGVSAAKLSFNDIGRDRADTGVAVWFSTKPAEDYSWQVALQIDSPLPTLEEIDVAYRKLARKHHPDMINQGSGGDPEMFRQLTDHRDKARSWVMGGDQKLDNCIPCDRFVEVRQNLAAIRLALGAFRQLERVGIPAILERVMDKAFKAALPNETAGK